MACFSSTSVCRPPPPFLARSSLTSACRRLLLFGLLFFNECSPLPPPPFSTHTHPPYPLVNPPPPRVCAPPPLFSSSRFPRSFAHVSLSNGLLNNSIFSFLLLLLCCCWGSPPPPRPLFCPEKERGLRYVASRGLLLSYFQGHARTHGTARKRKSFASMKGPSLALFCLQTGDSKRSG